MPRKQEKNDGKCCEKQTIFRERKSDKRPQKTTFLGIKSFFLIFSRFLKKKKQNNKKQSICVFRNCWSNTELYKKSYCKGESRFGLSLFDSFSFLWEGFVCWSKDDWLGFLGVSKIWERPFVFEANSFLDKCDAGSRGSGWEIIDSFNFLFFPQTN